MRLLSAIKKDIDFNANLYNLLEVLKEIAISQYKILEKKIKTNDDFFGALNAIFSMVHGGKIKHPFVDTGARQGAVIALTSDTGLLGGLNRNVMSQAVLEAHKIKGKLVILGEKGQIYAQESGLPFVVFKGVSDETRMKQAQELREYIVKEELEGRMGIVKMVYPVSLSIVSQQIKSVQLIPYVSTSPTKLPPPPPEIVMESGISDIFEYWVSLFLGQFFYQVFSQAKLAELSARFIHLESSKGKIDQLNKELRIQYFRQRHEMIDKNIRELFCARLAFK
jgi:ATP synthase F1 gamma subunit